MVLLVVEDLCLLDKDGTIKISHQLTIKIEEFKKHIIDDNFKLRLTKKEDIELADILIDQIIKEMEVF